MVQKSNFSPLEHYNTLGYIIVVLSTISIYVVYRVSRIVSGKKDEAAIVPDNAVLAE